MGSRIPKWTAPDPPSVRGSVLGTCLGADWRIAACGQYGKHPMASPDQNLLRKIPAVDVLLEEPEMARLWKTAGVPRRIVVDCVRRAVQHTRTLLVEGPPGH